MRTIIAGPRTCTDYFLVESAIKASGFSISQVISGGARGADELGEIWAANNSVPLLVMPACWRDHGKGAGAIRNRQMAIIADALVAVWNGTSKGTQHMISVAYEKGLKVYVHRYEDYEWTET